MAITLKVTPEVLERKAGEFTSIIKDIQSHFDRIQQISSKTKGYWQGDAGDRDREGYVSFKEDTAYLLKRLREHPDDLLKMAGIYRKAETEAKKMAGQLKTDQIV